MTTRPKVDSADLHISLWMEAEAVDLEAVDLEAMDLDVSGLVVLLGVSHDSPR